MFSAFNHFTNIGFSLFWANELKEWIINNRIDKKKKVTFSVRILAFVFGELCFKAVCVCVCDALFLTIHIVNA